MGDIRLNAFEFNVVLLFGVYNSAVKLASYMNEVKEQKLKTRMLCPTRYSLA